MWLRARPGPRSQVLPPAPRPSRTLSSPDLLLMSHGLFRSLTPHRPRHFRPPLPLVKQPPTDPRQHPLLCARARLSPVSPPPRPLPLTVLNSDPLLLPPLIALPPRARPASCCRIKDLPGLQPPTWLCHVPARLQARRLPRPPRQQPQPLRLVTALPQPPHEHLRHHAALHVTTPARALTTLRRSRPSRVMSTSSASVIMRPQTLPLVHACCSLSLHCRRSHSRTLKPCAALTLRTGAPLKSWSSKPCQIAASLALAFW